MDILSQPQPPLLDIYLGFGTRQSPQQQHHWTLILVPQRTSPSNCTFYHISSGPTACKRIVETNKSLSDSRLARVEKIGEAPCTEKTIRAIHLESRRTRAQRCHMYVGRLLMFLEMEGWIAPDTPDKVAAEMPKTMLKCAVDELGMEISEARRTLVTAAEFAQEMGFDPLAFCTCFE
ncbi:hypothetical protein BDW74DRAFT_179142 [Aspergillus multicolor]|uniref:uncharacterized protein n=1 Tax=Aspergillus multicolor TaxID=41759 RepID=UPI003CCCCB31